MNIPLDGQTIKVILLDVYQTLLDLSEIERKVNVLLDSKRGFTIWFERLMQYCLVDNCTGQFNNFLSIAKATLEMTMLEFDRRSGATTADDILERLKHLPLHEGVSKGLSQLHDKGYRLAALTNVPFDVVMERMERTGLISYFEQVLSAEQVKKYKPCVEVYELAARTLEVAPQHIMLVTSHGWDIAGAVHAGMQTAWLKLDRNALYPLTSPPQYYCKDIVDLASQI